MSKESKRYRAVASLVDGTKVYEPQEAVELAKRTASAKFDETVEAHIRLNVDPRHAEQQVRGVALLPHGLGKRIRVLVFTSGEGERIAREAGADHVGSDDLISQIEGGWLEFDVALATPEVMGRMSRLGRILGRRGLMPNPRAGTVVQVADLTRAIGEARKGRVEFRLDRTGIIHVPIGKASFGEEELRGNLAVLVDSIIRARPEGVKGQLIRSLAIATTMGPGVNVDVASASALRPAE